MPNKGSCNDEGAMVWFIPMPRAEAGKVIGETWYERTSPIIVMLTDEGSARRGARAALLGAKTW